MNDPNGLVKFQDEYHLFYQYNPFGDTWGHMSWGHAVSKDLVHWEHLDVALPEKKDRMAFSGCVVVDSANSAGFQTGREPALVAVYTGYRQSDGWQAQYLAYSNDRGRTWQDYSRQPVLDISSTDFRDPNVFPYEDEWRMVIALPTERKVRFYRSKDLKNWEFLSDFGPQGAVGGAWECPDFFPMKIEGEEKTRWILQIDLDRQAFAGGSGGQYFVGHFDGTRFTLDNPTPEITWPEGVPVALSYDVMGSGLWKREEGRCASTRQALGTARSELFELSQPWFNFQIKGGRHPDKLEARLVVDGQVVRRTTGFNGSELQPVSWDVTPWLGRQAHLELVDETKELWGYLEVARATLSKRPAPASRDLARWIDYGPDYYACISFHNTGERRVWLAWMNNWLYGQEIPTSPWRSSMSLPRELSLHRVNGVLELRQTPVSELKRGRGGKMVTADFKRTHLLATDLGPSSGELVILWEPEDGQALNFSLLGLDYHLDQARRELLFVREDGQQSFSPAFLNRSVVSLKKQDGPWEIRLFYDQSSVELFAQEGRIVHTARTFPKDMSGAKLQISADSGKLSVSRWEMPSIW